MPLFFGLTHGVLQQSLLACLLGMILGFLAVQSGSILPGIVFHVVHNTLALANTRITPEMIPNSPPLRTLVTPIEGGGCLFAWPVALWARWPRCCCWCGSPGFRLPNRRRKSWPRPSVAAGVSRPRWCPRKPLAAWPQTADNRSIMGHRPSEANRLLLKARFVFPVAGEPIRDGAVTIEGARIVAVGPCGRRFRARPAIWATWPFCRDW